MLTDLLRSDFSSVEDVNLLYQIFQKLEPILKSGHTDIFLLNNFAKFTYQRFNYHAAAKLYKKIYSIKSTGITAYNAWECLLKIGEIDESIKYGKIYCRHLFRFKRIEKLEKFLPVFLEKGGDQKFIDTLQIKMDFVKGQKQKINEFRQKYPEEFNAAVLDCTSEILRHRKFWKRELELNNLLANSFLEIEPLDEEEEKIIRRLILGAIFSSLVTNGLNKNNQEIIKRYALKYRTNILKVAIGEEKITSVSTNKQNDDILQARISLVNFLIEAREFEQAKEALEDLELGGLDMDLIRRFEKKIKIHQESNFKSMTMVRDGLLNEINNFIDKNVEVENEKTEKIHIKKFFEDKICNLKSSFDFKEFKNVFNQYFSLTGEYGPEELLEEFEDKFDELDDSQRVEMEYFKLLILFTQKKNIEVIASVEDIISNYTLNFDEKILFLNMKKKAYRAIHKEKEAEDVSNVIIKITREKNFELS